MPAGPAEHHLVATRWPDDQPWHDYPSFRLWFLAEHLRIGKQPPDDRVIASEYETRVVSLVRFRAHAEVQRWDAEQREGAGRR